MKFTEEWSEAALIHGVRSGGSEVVAEAAWRLGTEDKSDTAQSYEPPTQQFDKLKNV